MTRLYDSLCCESRSPWKIGIIFVIFSIQVYMVSHYNYGSNDKPVTRNHLQPIVSLHRNTFHTSPVSSPCCLRIITKNIKVKQIMYLISSTINHLKWAPLFEFLSHTPLGINNKIERENKSCKTIDKTCFLFYFLTK
jgi:hypothetical protein